MTSPIILSREIFDRHFLEITVRIDLGSDIQQPRQKITEFQILSLLFLVVFAMIKNCEYENYSPCS